MAALPATERWAFLHTRLGRRLFAAFAFAALVPIGLLAGLSWERVGDELREQSRNRLHQAARASGMRVIEKLDGVESELASTTPEEASPRFLARLDARVAALDWLAEDGAARRLVGDGEAVPTDRSALPASGGKLFVDSSGQDVSVSLAVASPGGSGWWVAELDPGYLFDHGATNVLPVAGEVCIRRGELRIHCTFDDVLPVHSSEPREGAPDFEQWRVRGEVHLGVQWPLFLRARYQQPNWIIAVSEPRALALGPTSAFRALVPPTALLAALLVACLTAFQIRRQLVPLERLAEGTRRVADGDFSFDLEIEGDDELAQLAAVFRSMTQRVAEQFQSMEHLIEVDRQILECNDADQVLEIALAAVQVLQPAPRLAIVRQLMHADTAALIVRQGEDVQRRDIEAAPELSTEPRREPFRIVDAKLVPAAVAEGADPDLEVAVEFPLRVGSSSYGALWIWVETRAQVDVAQSLLTGQFASQLAAALHGIQLREEKDLLLNFDARTGLPNRTGLRALIRERVRRHEAKSEMVAIAQISLRGLSRMERATGRSEADRFVSKLADEVRAETGADVGRPREDALVVVFGSADRTDVPTQLRAIHRTLDSVLEAEDRSHTFELATGVAVFPIDGRGAEALLEAAAEACSHAHETSSSDTAFFSLSMREAAADRAAIESDLATATSREEFRLLYQPIVDAQTLQIVAAEALVRWQHPVRGLVAPDEFIPVAEESGLIGPIGSWVMRQACEDIAVWSRECDFPIRVSVNVANAQVQGGSLLSEIQSALAMSGASPSSLGIELTEHSFMAGDLATHETLSAIRRTGVAVSIDDFGTGYSSLAYLRRLPVDILKLDRSFLEGVPDDPGAAALVEAILAMAQALRLTVVAEGVETREQLGFLRRHGCDCIQGYFFAPPLSAAEFRESLEKGVETD